MANYTINSKSNTVAISETADLDELINATNRTLNIIPLPGYVVAEADFTIDATNITGVTSVTTSDTTVAYEPGNEVKLLVEFDGSINLTSVPPVFTLPIVGDAILHVPTPDNADEVQITETTFDLVTIADLNTGGTTTTFTPANGFSFGGGTVTLSTATVLPGEPIVVGTYVVEVAGDNQITEVPTLTNTSGIVDYSELELALETKNITTVDGNITSYEIDLVYTSINKTQKEDQVAFKFEAKSKPKTSTTLTIENITNTNKTINAKGGNTTYKVYGTAGSKFKFRVLDTTAFTGTYTTGQAVIATSTAGIEVGSLITGDDIQEGSYVISIDPDVSITISSDILTDAESALSYNLGYTSVILAESEYEIKQTGRFSKGTSYVSIVVDYPTASITTPYTLRITEVLNFGILSEAIKGGSNSNDYFEYTVYQYMDPIIRFKMNEGTLTGMAFPPNALIDYTGKTNTNINELKYLKRIDSPFNINWVVTSNAAMAIKPSPGGNSLDDLFDITELDAAGSTVYVDQDIRVALSNNYLTATISFNAYLLKFGEHTAVDGVAAAILNLDSIITQQLP